MAWGKKGSKGAVKAPSEMDLCIQHIFDSIKAGHVGSSTMQLYVLYSTSTANKAVRELLDRGAIKITSPVTGYDLKTSTEYGVKQALATKNFSVSRA